ncbi:MAG: DUF3570 domain-containing protein [Verrucomicrobia bacterium]|nr:DUF3570 domain-containing protein [Verrucomicrobiota bacterium]
MKNKIALAPLLMPVMPLAGAEAFKFDTSYQVYDEADGRIQVESRYFRGEMYLGDKTTFRFQILNDAISGATPGGALPGGTQPFLSELEDLRVGVLGALSQQFGDHTVELELSRSRESDYLSEGVALSDKWELNQKNTTLTIGFNYLADEIKVIGIDNQKKKSYDFVFGVSQLLDKNTVLAATLTAGYASGYLNDQYKFIQRDEILSIDDGAGGTIDIPLTEIYRENRPDSRVRGVLQVQLTHYFEKIHAALDITERVAQDDYGVFSQSLQIEWRQGFGGHLEVTPFFRYYQQTAADFYHQTLNEVSLGKPENYPTGKGPNYSADYRLSSMETLSFGIKTKLRLGEHFSLTAAFENYAMNGVGSRQAPEQMYPTASIWTFGGTIQF